MATLEFPTAEQIKDLVEATRAGFKTGKTLSLDWRKKQLRGILRFCREKHSLILEALEIDLGKSSFEGMTSEVVSVEWEAHFALKHLNRWAAPEKVRTPLLHQPGRSYILKEPLGLVLIIGAWNYPVQLTLVPLVAAIAAGNAAVLKPSEVSQATSRLLATELPKYLDPNAFTVLQGGAEETTEILKLPFDHIFYTGNPQVARIVMEAAAKNLTPVTLELGGKSPCLVDETADLALTAKRLIWGKFFNCGQTCVAPDYLLVEKAVAEPLKAQMLKTVEKFWSGHPETHSEYGRIVNSRHFDRIMGLLDNSGQVLCGGKGDKAKRYIAPTLIADPPETSPLLKEEIFGPILPILEVDSVSEAVNYVNDRPKPLVLYLFSENPKTQEFVLNHTSSGGVVLNHCLLHNLSPDLPFGGVGESGIGAYHGKAGFEALSHRKSVLKKPFYLDNPTIYPHLTGRLTKFTEQLIKIWRKVRA